MKKTLSVVYLNHDGYLKWFRDWFGIRGEDDAEKSWCRKLKTNIDGIEYVRFINHPSFTNTRQMDIAYRYGFETFEEIEWTSL